jgi:hypothetical protein
LRLGFEKYQLTWKVIQVKIVMRANKQGRKEKEEHKEDILKPFTTGASRE